MAYQARLERRQSCGRHPRGKDLDHPGGVGQPLEYDLAPIYCADTLDLIGHLQHRVGSEDLAGSSKRTETGGEVDGLAAIVTPNADGLAGIQANAGVERRARERLLPVDKVCLEDESGMESCVC
jgi:hypothetical protein